MFHKITHLLKFFHKPPPPESEEFAHLQALLARCQVVDPAGCLRRAFRHGWKFHQVQQTITAWCKLRSIDPEAWTPGRLYDHLNLARAGRPISDHPIGPLSWRSS